MAVSLASNAKKAFDAVYKLVNAFPEKPKTVSMEGAFAQCNFCGKRGIREIFVSNATGEIFLPGFPNFSISMDLLADLKKPRVLKEIKQGEDSIIIKKMTTEKVPEDEVILYEHDWSRKENPFDLLDSLEWVELKLPQSFDVVKYNFETGNVALPGAEETHGAVLYIDNKIMPKDKMRGTCYLAIEAYEENFIHPVIYCEGENFKILIRYMKILS